jgi:DNA modification methylase
VWRRYASPVWMDINQGRVLKYREGRHEDDERHICPLQLDVIERCVELWSNKNEICLSPFAGIGSEPYSFLKMERKAIGIELKKSYYDTMVKNIENIGNEMNSVKKLF